MPFDYVEYQKKCDSLSTEQLHKEWENYTRQIAGGATSTATSVLFSPLTGGVSLIGLGLSAPRVHNARKKREIIEAGLQKRGTTHETRKRDVMGSVALSGALGGLTLGLAGPGADMIAGEAVGKGAEYMVAHAALDGAGATLEHAHDKHSKTKAEDKLQQQYQNFQKQFMEEQAKLQGTPVQQLAYQPGMPMQQPGTPNPQFMQQNGQPLQNPQYLPPNAQQQVPSNQPWQQAPAQDQEYEYVPIPAAHNTQIQYQPASHQQQYAQPAAEPQPNAYQQPPQYQPPQQSVQQQEKYHLVTVPGPSSNLTPQYQPIQQPEKYMVTAPAPPAQSYSPEKSAAYASTAPMTQQVRDMQSPTLLPLYSEPIVAQNIAEKSATVTVTEVITSPDNDPPPAAPTMEEEIAFLKARLLQMEIEKRAAAAQAAPASQTEQSRSDSISGPPPAQNQSALNEAPLVIVTDFVHGQQIGPLGDGQINANGGLTVTSPNAVLQQGGSTISRAASPALPQRSTSVAPQQQYAPPPPASPNTQTQNYVPPPPASPNPKVQNYVPPPPASPHPQTQIYVPPPPASPHPQQQSTYQPQLQPQQQSTYQPQNFPAPPSPFPQQQQQQQYQPQPNPSTPNPQQQYQRQDSGYYSAAPTPSASGRPTSMYCSTPQPQAPTPPQQYNPQAPIQQPQPFSPQSTGPQYHGRSSSVASLASPPPPYFPPPPGAPNANLGAGGKDYFSQGPVPQQNQGYQPQQGGYQPQMYGNQRPQSMLGTQGWQWGMPAPVGVVVGGQAGGEPNYGPPPPVPNAWKG